MRCYQCAEEVISGSRIRYWAQQSCCNFFFISCLLMAQVLRAKHRKIGKDINTSSKQKKKFYDSFIVNSFK